MRTPESNMLTRGQMLEAAAKFAGLVAAGCIVGGCGHRHSIVPAVDAAQALPSATQIQAIGGSADASRQAVRLHPPDPPPPLQFWEAGALYRTFNATGRFLTLTFDDGPWPDWTDSIRTTLASKGLKGKAAFAQVAQNALHFTDIGKRVIDDGHEIINHSLTHSIYTASGEAAEIVPAQELFESIYGFRPRFFRSPGLTVGSPIQQVLFGQNMANILTDTNPNDSTVPRISPLAIETNVRHQAHAGNFILLHDGGTHANTATAVGPTIDGLRADGWEFVSLEEGMRMGATNVSSLVIRATGIRIESVDEAYNRAYFSADGLWQPELLAA